jgi:hypothetical protein
MRQLLAAMLLATTAASVNPALGQAPPAQTGPATSVWSTNPLGFLQLGPNLEFERALSPASALGAGIRLPTLGLTTHLINDGIKSGWSAYGIYRFYPKRSALRGWYVGPHVEIGGTSNETYTSRLLGGAGEFGHRWIKPSGFSITLGGLLGMLKSNDTWKDDGTSAGSETYFIWMLNVSLGLSR